MLSRRLISGGSKRIVSRLFSKEATPVAATSNKFKETYGLFINGKEVFPEGAETFEVTAPFNGAKLCNVVSADAAITCEVIENAQLTFESGIWSNCDVRERAKVMNNIAALLRKNIPRLAELEVYQTGRSIREMNVCSYGMLCFT